MSVAGERGSGEIGCWTRREKRGLCPDVHRRASSPLSLSKFEASVPSRLLHLPVSYSFSIFPIPSFFLPPSLIPPSLTASTPPAKVRVASTRPSRSGVCVGEIDAVEFKCTCWNGYPDPVVAQTWKVYYVHAMLCLPLMSLRSRSRWEM